MRKALGILIIILLILSGSVYNAAMDIYGERDKVVLSEEVIYGESSAVDNLTVKHRSNYDNHLFWNTTYKAGTAPEIETDYTFSAKSIYEPWEEEYDGITTFTDFGIELNLPEWHPWYGLSQVYQEVIDKANPYVEESVTVYLKDCMEYYPLSVMVSLPGVNLGWSGIYYSDVDGSNGEEYAEPGTETYVIQKFQEYFKIPVLENEQIEIYVEVDENGHAYSHGMGTGIGEVFNMGSFSAVTDQVCYFTFDTAYCENGYPVDTSHIPGGYGIYALPYDADYHDEIRGRLCGLMIDELEMVYSLNPEIQILHLGVSEDQRELILHTNESGKYIITVISLETMEQTQIIELMDMPEEYYDLYIHEDSNFFSVIMPRYKATVIEKNIDGYNQCWLVDMEPDEESDYISRYSDVDFDGENMVLADYLGGMFESTDFYIMVFNSDGLKYHARYYTSLNAGDSSNRYAYRCQPGENNPLLVSWDE